MAAKKPLVLNGGQLQRLQSNDTLDPSGLFDANTNLGGINGLATNGITVHNGTAFTTVSLTAPAAGMTIDNANGTAGNPTFAFTGELSQLISMTTGMVVKTGTGTLEARTIQGTTGTITVTNGSGVSGNPTITIADNPVIPGTGAMTVPTGNTVQQPTPTAGMMRYNSQTNKFEFREGAAWVNYGTSNSVGTVTSVDVALPDSLFSASNGPITTAGTITFTLDTQAAFTVFAGPNAAGPDAAPTFRALVEGDIPTLNWSKITSTPTSLAGYGILDSVVYTTRTINTTVGQLTGGGALTADLTLGLATVGTAVSDSFKKITTDAYGRVTATAAVGSSDITTALGYTPVSDAGDTMTGNLVMSGATVTGLPLTAVNSTDAASKAYVDNVVASGTTWRDPVSAPNLVDVVATTAEPTAPASRRQYIVYGGVPTAWTGVGTVSSGDLMEYQVTPVAGWVKIGTLSAGDRFTVAGEVALSTSSALYTAGLRRMDLIQYVSGDPTVGSNWTTPHDAGIGAVMYTAELTSGAATGLANDATVYNASVSINGTSYPITVSGDAGVGVMTVGELLTEITADVTGVATASLVAGHIHIEATNPDHRVIITDGGTNPLFSTVGAGMEIRATIDAGTTVLVSNTLSQDNGRTGLFSGGADGDHSWIEIGGPTAINAGVGLAFNGNVLNVNLGAGIIELPSDEVGLDIEAGKAIQLTSSLTNGKLTLLTDGSTLSQSALGLKVAGGGITATELNASVAGAGLSLTTELAVNVDGSTLEINSDALRVKAAGITESHLAASVAGAGLSGGAGTALSVNVDGSSLEINVDTLRIKAGGVTNTMLATSSVSLASDSGTGSVALGGTLTLTGGTGIDTSTTGSTTTITLNATLDDLSDVTITTAAAGDVIYRNAGNTAWVNGAPGATSGVQPYDTTLTALAGLTNTPGMVVESGTDAFVTRVLTGGTGITVTNGDGISGDPTVALTSGVVTAGTYSSVTVDTYGRVTAGSAIEASTQVAMVNANAGTLVIGTPVFVGASGVDKTDATAMPAAKAIGLVADVAGIATTATGNIAVAGILTATVGQWDAVVDESIPTGLTAGATYYLSENTGMLTTAAPTAGFIAPVGVALSTTKMKIQIDPTIQL